MRLHQRGWQAKLRVDATFEVTDPSGVVRVTHADGPAHAAGAGLFSPGLSSTDLFSADLCGVAG